jgi:hypothetical protein
VQVEARLLGQQVARLLTSQVHEPALQRRDRGAQRARRAHLVDVRLGHRPLDQLLEPHAVGRLDRQPLDRVAAAVLRGAPPRLRQRLLGPHAVTVPIISW